MLAEISSLLFQVCDLDSHSIIIVGFSGGADSLCLLDILNRLGYPLLVAHLDHAIRPASSDDAAKVMEFADSLGLRVSIRQESVPDYAEKENLSVEEAARILRYRYLFALAKLEKAQAVVVAHNADDQVETILMHFLRGTGLDGLGGMEVVSLPNPWSNSIPLIRPLLGVWRKEIDTYCAERGLNPLQDQSNLDPKYFRNRLRHELLPELRNYVPGIDKRIWQLADLVKADQAVLDSVVTETWNTVARSRDGSTVINIEKFNQQPLGVKRRIIRRAVKELRPVISELDYAFVQRVLDFILIPSRTKQAEIGMGLKVILDRGNLVMIDWDGVPETGEFPQISEEAFLEVPGELALPSGWVISAEETSNPMDSMREVITNLDPYQAWIDLTEHEPILLLRTRKPGERFRPWGMDGKSVKISDVMINLKIPSYVRSHWPLICIGGEIAWVPGFRIAQSYAVTPETKHAVFLRFEKRKNLG